MWQWIAFTPAEEHALEATDQEMADMSWEELGIPRPEGGVLGAKTSRLRCARCFPR